MHILWVHLFFCGYQFWWTEEDFLGIWFHGFVKIFNLWILDSPRPIYLQNHQNCYPTKNNDAIKPIPQLSTLHEPSCTTGLYFYTQALYGCEFKLSNHINRAIQPASPTTGISIIIYIYMFILYHLLFHFILKAWKILTGSESWLKTSWAVLYHTY